MKFRSDYSDEYGMPIIFKYGHKRLIVDIEKMIYTYGFYIEGTNEFLEARFLWIELSDDIALSKARGIKVTEQLNDQAKKFRVPSDLEDWFDEDTFSTTIFANEVEKYLETGKKGASAIKAYDLGSKGGSDTQEKLIQVAGAIATENLKKPKVKQYLEDNAEGATLRIVELSKKAKNEAVKLNANKDILDRAGYKPIEKTDIDGNLSIKWEQ